MSAVWLSVARFGLVPAFGATIVLLGALLAVLVARLTAEDAREHGRFTMAAIGALAFVGAMMAILPVLFVVLGGILGVVLLLLFRS